MRLGWLLYNYGAKIYLEGVCRKKTAKYIVLILCALSPVLSGCVAEANAQNIAVVFNEAVTSNHYSFTDPEFGSPDWIELFNGSSRDMNLSGYKLMNKNGTKTYTFGDSAIPSNGYLLIYATEKTAEIKNGVCCTNFSISKDGETLLLVDSKNYAVASIAIPALQADVSYARRDDGTYGYCAKPTPGSKNNDSSILNLEKLKALLQSQDLALTEVLPENSQSYAKAELFNTGAVLTSAGQDRMDAGDPVRLNELLIHNRYSIKDGNGERLEWAELYNSSAEAVPLKGYYLSDSRDNLYKWPFPDVSIEPESYLIVFLSGKDSRQGELHASFCLSDGETGLYLTNRYNGRFDFIPLVKQIGDNISIGPDSNGTMQYYLQPTPGKANGKGVDDARLVGYFDQAGVYISEVSSASKAKSGQNDWVELHNASGAAIDLSGYYLSDNIDDIKKWQIPSLSIEANGYAVIEASADKGKQNKSIAGFGISPGGETLLLSDPQGNILDVFDTGVLKANITSGRIEGNNTIKRVFFNSPTKGKANSQQIFSGYAAKPILSDSSLYHTQAFTLALTCSTPGAKIYYTLDGSTPTQNSTAYNGPISISKNTVVSAIAYSDGLLPSEVSTATYLFDTPHTVPVVCITGNPANVRRVLFTNSKNGYESAVNIQYFEADGSLGISFPAGIRAKGKATLRLAQNSLTIALRSNYGVKSVKYPFFADSDQNEYTTLSLRNSGQDIANARLRDSFFQKVSKGMKVDSIETRTVVAYVNGVFWGLYDLNEEQNDDFFSAHYGIDSNSIDKINGDGKVLDGSKLEFNRICKMARTWNLKDDKVFAEFSKYVDVDACIDYLVMQIYFGNGDVVNNRFWRSQDYAVKWRPVLFDLDFCLRNNDVNRNVFKKYLTRSPSIGAGLTVHMYIFNALCNNKSWRDKFIKRFVELSETQFKPERILAIYDEMVKTMKPEMERQIARWHKPVSMAVWLNQTSKLRTAIENRRDAVLRQLQNYFDIPDSAMQEYKRFNE